MHRPMCRNHTDPFNTAILHLCIRVQALGDRFGDDRPLVLLQNINLCLDICNECIDFGACGIEEIGNTLLFIECRL